MAKYLSITREELISFKPCDINERLKLFGRHKSINAHQALKLGVSIGDMLWVLDKLGREDIIVSFSFSCAQHIARNNRDPRVQAIIDATMSSSSYENTEFAARYVTCYAAMYAAISADRSAEETWQRSKLLDLLRISS